MYLGLNSKIILAFIMCLFLVSLTSAATFDNRVIYEEETKTITIKDHFNLPLIGRDLVSIQLLSNTYICLTECEAIWNVTIFADDDNFLTDLVFEGAQVKSHEFQLLTGFVTNRVDTYGDQNCKVVDVHQDGSDILSCDRVVNGSFMQTSEVWTSFDPERRLPIRNYIIKLKGTKDWKATTDWIPTYYGKEIRQWAFWTSTDPTTVWEFNEEPLDLTANDSLRLNNLTTNSSTGHFTTGHLNNSWWMNNTNGLTSLNKTISSTNHDFDFDVNNFTVAFWINTNASTSGWNPIDYNITGSGWGLNMEGVNDRIAFRSDSNILFTNTTINDGQWHRLVWVREGTGANQFKLYEDNNNTGNVTFSTNVTTQDTLFRFIAPNVAGEFAVDNVEIFNGFAWTVEDVNTDYNGGAGREAGDLDLPSLVIILNSPANDTSFLTRNITFNASVSTIENLNLTNATIRIYNSTTNLFNQSNIPVSGDSVINESIFSIGNFIVGTYFWNVEFCSISDNASSSTVCSDATSNFTLVVNAISNQSVNFSNPTIEGSTESFILNVTFNSSSLNLDSAIFTYNSTLSSALVVGIGDNRLVTSSIIIPSIVADTNKSFFWNLSFIDLIAGGNVQESTTLTNQSVLNIGIDNCDSFTVRILNFTVQDEELQTFITDATIETAVNLFDQNRVGLVANVSGNFTNPTTICLSLNVTNTTVYSLDTIARYESPLHANEYFNIVNFTLDINSTVQDIILFDLNLSDSTEFQLTFTGSDFLPVENALVFVDRQYISENVFKTVELPKTDANGQTILHLVRNDIVYNIRISKDGTLLGNFENLIAFCEDFAIGDCKIILNAGSGTEVLFNYDTELGITFTGPTYNNDTRIITFDFLTFDGSAKTVLMNVTRSDIFGNRTVCEDSLLSSGGTLSCTIPSNIDDADLIINVFVDGQESIFKVIRLDLTDFGVAGYLVLFVMALSLILMFSASKTGILLAVLLSFAGAIGMGLITSNLLGVGASGLWLIIITLIGIWKLNKDRIQ